MHSAYRSRNLHAEEKEKKKEEEKKEGGKYGTELTHPPNIPRTMSTRNFAADPIFESTGASDAAKVVVFRIRYSRGAENGVF